MGEHNIHAWQKDQTLMTFRTIYGSTPKNA